MSLLDVLKHVNNTSLESGTRMDELHILPEVRLDQLMLENNDPAYHDCTDKELLTHVSERHEQNYEEDDNIATQIVSHA